jgi:hypothetical protein
VTPRPSPLPPTAREILVALLRAALDAAVGYRACADAVPSSPLRDQWAARSAASARLATALRTELDAHGVAAPRPPGNGTGWRRDWYALPAALATGSPQAVEAACRRAEERLRTRDRRALAMHLSERTHANLRAELCALDADAHALGEREPRRG